MMTGTDSALDPPGLIVRLGAVRKTQINDFLLEERSPSVLKPEKSQSSLKRLYKNFWNIIVYPRLINLLHLPQLLSFFAKWFITSLTQDLRK